MHLVRKFLADRQAATAVEYGLLAAIMGAALIGGFGVFSDSLQNMFSTIETNVTGAGD